MSQHGAVAMDTAHFVDLLLRTVPEAGDLHREHLEDNFGELLLHPLVADVRRLSFRAFEAGDRDLLRRCLEVMDAALRDGDVELENAVAVSFVEDTGWWDPDMQLFVAAWPAALRAEAERQAGYPR